MAHTDVRRYQRRDSVPSILDPRMQFTRASH